MISDEQRYNIIMAKKFLNLLQAEVRLTVLHQYCFYCGSCGITHHDEFCEICQTDLSFINKRN